MGASGKTVKVLDLPCGCKFDVNDNFVGGERQFECVHEVWKITAWREREVHFDMRIVEGGKDSG